MAATLPEIAPDFAEWLRAQPMFFVATAPNDGHVNVSPKGYDTFRVLGPHRVAYLDLTGSGVETIAHIRENGRITLMFCAFSGNPRIARLYGVGRVYELGSPDFETLVPAFEALPGARAIIEVDVTRVTTSCGYSVPLLDLVEDRDRLVQWAVAKGEDALVDYRSSKNATSVDGLPGYGA
ncbi:MAG: pyridoxamine 5'-phosphate oxidase family protein [Acidimicrobiia bacterium]